MEELIKPPGREASPRPPQRGIIERALRIAVALGLAAVILWLLWFFSALVIYLIVGLVLAYLLSPLVDRVQGIGIGRVGAIIIMFLSVLAGLVLLMTFFLPFIVRQVSGLSQLISLELIVQVAETIERYSGGILRAEAVVEAARRALGTLFQDEQMSRTMDALVDLFTDVFYAVLVIPFVTFFVLKDGNKIRHNLLWLVPNRYFEITIALIEKIELNVGRYFRALLLQCTSVAVTATVLLSVVGLDYAIAVGIFTGLANTIPYLGPAMGFVAGTIVSIAQTGDTTLVLGVLVAMMMTQIADNVFFQPLIFARAARTHPLVILFIVLIGAQVAGIVGMLVAIPVSATLRVAASQIHWSVRNYRILRAR